MKVAVRYARHAGIAALFVAAALLGTLSGVLFAYSDDLPEVSALDNYAPNTITRVLGQERPAGRRVRGRAPRRHSLQRHSRRTCARRSSPRRTPASSSTRASASRAWCWRCSATSPSRGKSPGGSTITQQLTRNLFPAEIGFAVGNRSWERKIKESLVAIRIEKRYTKEEIFTFYCNQIYFGHGAYGVEAASQLYFRKPAKDLEARRGGDDRRHHPGQRPAEPVRESGSDQAPPQLRARADGRRRASSPREAADAAKEKPVVVARRSGRRRQRRAVLPRRGPQVSRGQVRRQGALRERPHRADRARHRGCSRPRTRRSIAACAASTSGAASASRAATSSPKARRSTASRPIAGRAASPKATSCRPWSAA